MFLKSEEVINGKELYKLALNLSREYRPQKETKSSLDRRKRDGK